MIRQRAASGILPSAPGSSGVIVVVTDTTVVVVVIVPVREILQLGSMVEEEEPPPPPVTVEEALEGEALTAEPNKGDGCCSKAVPGVEHEAEEKELEEQMTTGRHNSRNA